MLSAEASTLFGWRLGGRSDGTKGAGPKGGSGQAPCEPIVRLHTYLCRTGVPALLRPLGTSLALVEEAVRGQPVSSPVQVALSAAADFFAAREAPERHLEFALAVHTCQAATRCFLGGVETALSELSRKQGEGMGGRTHVALEAWRSGVRAFEEGCREAWELHAYFTFLDVKGDRALLDLVADRFCELLEFSPDALGACLARTRPWAEDALKELAKRGSLQLFERQHSAALVQWHASWMKRYEKCGTNDSGDGSRFWESCFENLLKCSWPDFAEAFEDTFMDGPLPSDMMAQLQKSLDPKNTLQVSQSSWKTLMQKHSTVWNLVGVLVAEVLADVSPQIYRAKPLPRLSRPSVKRSSAKTSSESAASEAVPIGNTSPEGSQKKDAKAPHKGRSSQAGFPAETSKAPAGQDSAGSDSKLPVPLPGQSELVSEASPTPVDLRMMGRPGGGRHLSWDEYVTDLTQKDRPWWLAPGEHWQEDEADDKEPLRVTALRMVNSTMQYTYRALVLRIVSGDLGNNAPILGHPEGSDKKGSRRNGGHPQPAVVVLPNSSRHRGITRFGRDSYRQNYLPDVAMGEPIASRSHFCVSFNQESNSYQLMDAGSKWGTFTKVGVAEGMTLSCGDWVRVGNAEFLIRYCGGGCNCAKQHAHYRLHSLRVLKEQAGLLPLSSSLQCRRPNQRRPQFSECGCNTWEQGESSEDENMRDNVMQLLSGVRQRGWVSEAAHLCERAAEVGSSRPTVSASSRAEASEVKDRPTNLLKEANLVPVSPLELDFISGPCAGQRFSLCERLCTMGRGDGNTIQVSDPMLSNISRLHCIFEWEVNRWRIRDNNSTNGTWRRLSCVLDPSKLIPLDAGTSVLAGVHEFQVEEADMWHCYLPSTASAVLEAKAAKHRGSS